MAINFQYFNKEHEFVTLIFQRQMIAWIYKGYF